MDRSLKELTLATARHLRLTWAEVEEASCVADLTWIDPADIEEIEPLRHLAYAVRYVEERWEPGSDTDGGRAAQVVSVVAAYLDLAGGQPRIDEAAALAALKAHGGRLSVEVIDALAGILERTIATAQAA